MPLFDLSTKNGAHADDRLREEPVIWLTTVKRDGQPQSSPVWFLWDGQTFLHYSQEGRQKVRNIQRNPLVSLHLNDDGHGGDIVTIEGQAEIGTNVPAAHQNPAYLEKYRQGIASLGMNPETFGRTYTVAIRITPLKARVW